MITTGSPEVDRGIVSFVVTLALAFVQQRLLIPRVKLRWAKPHKFSFVIAPQAPGQQTGLVHTETLLIGNFGRVPATNIEIFHVARPPNFQVWPHIAYEEGKNPDGTHIIRVKTLAPKEVFQVEIIGPDPLPMLTRVRSDAGEAKAANIAPQAVAPRWLIVLLILLIFAGAAWVVYVSLWVAQRLIGG